MIYGHFSWQAQCFVRFLRCGSAIIFVAGAGNREGARCGGGHISWQAQYFARVGGVDGLPPQVTCQSSEASASYETSSKTHPSSLQSKRFIRDFLQKSRVKPPQGASRTAKQVRDSIPSKQHLLRRQSQCHGDIHLHHSSQPRDSRTKRSCRRIDV